MRCCAGCRPRRGVSTFVATPPEWSGGRSRRWSRTYCGTVLLCGLVRDESQAAPPHLSQQFGSAAAWVPRGADAVRLSVLGQGGHVMISLPALEGGSPVRE